MAEPCTPEVDRWTLPDGTVVRARPLQAADRALETEFLESLSERTRYFRLMTPLRYLSPELLTQLMDVNGRDKAALVATVADNTAERFIAVARYAATDQSGTAELGVTVADAWQHRGIATRLVRRLMEHAARQGIHKLVGIVLPDNQAMLGLAHKLGFSVRFDPAKGLMDMSLCTDVWRDPSDDPGSGFFQKKALR